MQPQVVVSLTKENVANYKSTFNVPVVQLSKDNVTYYPQDFEIIGQITGNVPRANQLANFWNGIIANTTAQTAQAKKNANGWQPKVVYFNGGSMAQPKLPGYSTVFASEIRMDGGINYYDNLTNPSLNGNQLWEKLEAF